MYYTMSSQSSPSSLSSSVQRGHCTLMPPALSPQKRPSQTKQNCTTQRGKNRGCPKGKKEKEEKKKKRKKKREENPPRQIARNKSASPTPFCPHAGQPPNIQTGTPN